MNDDTGGRRRRIRSPRPGLPAAVAGLALLAAACGGGSSTPQVASLGTSGGSGGGSPATSGDGSAGATAAGSDGNPTQLLDEWAACIRGHGDPGQADPIIDADKDIEITMVNVPKALENEVHGSTGPCSNYLLAAENALRGGQPAPTYDPVTALKVAACIRASGFPNYPDPSADGETNFNGTGVDPNSPAVLNATKSCDERFGVPDYGNGTAPPGVVQVLDCFVPAGMQCPSGSPPGGGGLITASSGSAGSDGHG